MVKKIPIARPYLGEEEAIAATQAILSGWVTQGPRVERFEKEFSRYVGAEYACATSSCTTALHLALLAVGVRPGDVVITVSHSFIATANSVRLCGAEPIFVDIDLRTFNISCIEVEKFLKEECEKKEGRLYYKKAKELARGQSPVVFYCTGRVAAIMPVHQMGMPADMKSILSLARRFNLPVVEDAACAVGSEISMDGGISWERIGKPHGDIACFSFHPRKVITTGDGGMLTTNNSEYDKVFRLLRHHGMSVSDTARHAAGKVIFEEYLTTGYNYRMTDIQAAVGMEQLKKLPNIMANRRKIADLYRRELEKISWLKLPEEPEYCRTNWQSYAVTILDGAPRSRDDLMQYLLDNGISTRRGVMNAHQEKPYANSNFDLKNSEKARDSVILLPIFYGLKESEVEKIAELMKNA
ncbi:MAG: DegT/DnrJ/EryC1/StrS family aminotransferase [Candidatus Omnitrophica bacterium]|nr:DegT/DnrJ/EryC1/StrS family aminotransferase [Candidatus Omnitrophota bacterium]MCM8790635.1 DegT/DnrJ/EryC1/StrS family aminotransferase [Candidatus Omnitrophota bacterium]